MTMRILIALTLLAVAATASAQSTWAVAERSDEQIVGLVDRLLPFVEKVEGGEDADAVVLYTQTMGTFDDPLFKRCTNRVFLVRDASALPERWTRPRIGNPDRIEVASAFVLRDGAIVRRLEPEYEEGREHIGRNHVRFEWGDLQSGDVIGWSMVVEQEQIMPVFGVRLAEEFPIVYAALSVDGGESYVYEPRWWGVSASDLQIKEQDGKDGRIFTVKINSRLRPAVDSVPDDMPFPESYPHVWLTLDELWIEPEDQGMLRPGWASTNGWNQYAVQAAASLESLAEETGGLNITVSAITTGKQTAHAKAEAITEWVRDSITELDGPDINARATRPDFEEVFESREGTESEKDILAAVMMIKAGVPVTVASFRDPTIGAFDPDWESAVQITDSVIRVEDRDTVRYYAPSCVECAPGTIPEEWIGAQAVVYDADFPERAEAFQEKKQAEALASGSFDIGALQREFEDQPFTRIETIAGPQ